MAARLAALINELTEQDAPPSLTTCLRIAKACQDDIEEMRCRVDAIDPVTRPHFEIRPLALLEREAIETAMRQLGSVEAAAAALQIGPATIYRRLREWRVEAPATKTPEVRGRFGQHELSSSI